MGIAARGLWNSVPSARKGGVDRHLDEDLLARPRRVERELVPGDVLATAHALGVVGVVAPLRVVEEQLPVEPESRERLHVVPLHRDAEHGVAGLDRDLDDLGVRGRLVHRDGGGLDRRAAQDEADDRQDRDEERGAEVEDRALLRGVVPPVGQAVVEAGESEGVGEHEHLGPKVWADQNVPYFQ